MARCKSFENLSLGGQNPYTVVKPTEEEEEEADRRRRRRKRLKIATQFA